MLRIGDLARRAGVTVRTLRYYDELGLLRPERVDPDTGYYGRPDGSKIDVAVGAPLGDDAGPVDGLELAELTAEEPAAAVVFRGPPDEIADAWYTFEVTLEQRGLESFGVNRQLFVDAPEGSDEWLVELQCPVRERGSGCVT